MGKSFLYFLSLAVSVLGHMCPREQFYDAYGSGTCVDCHPTCVQKAIGCSGFGSEDCLFACPTPRECFRVEAPTDASYYNEMYVERGSPVSVFKDVIITDADYPKILFIEEATIWAANCTLASQTCFDERLISVDVGYFGELVRVVSENPSQSIHLKGSASITIYEHIIQTAKFFSTEPPCDSVTIAVRISDGEFLSEANVTLRVKTINDSPPRIEGIPLSEPVFIPGEGGVLIAEKVALEDCDNNNVHLWTKVEARISTQTSDFVDEFLEVNAGSVDSVVQSNASSQQHVILVPSEGKPYASIDDFERILRTLTYENRNDSIICPVARVINLRALDGVFVTEKNVTVVIELHNQFKPVLSIIRTGHSFEEDGRAVRLVSRARVTDRDRLCDFRGANVTLTAPDGEDDRIVFALAGTSVSMAGRVANGDGTVTIRLTGTADSHTYATVMKSIAYENTADEPTLTQRIVWINVFDGKFYSVSSMIKVDLVSRNDQPPVFHSPHMIYNFTENGPPTSFSGIWLTDADSDPDDRKANFIEVWIANPLNVPDEHLYVEMNDSIISNGITVMRMSPSHVKIVGDDNGDPLLKFTRRLQTLSYANINSEPAPGRRRIEFRIRSNAISPNDDVRDYMYVDVFGVNDSPTWLGISALVNYTERMPPIRLNPRAMPMDDDLQPIDVPILSLEITVLGSETGALIDCPGCRSCDNIPVINVSPQRIHAMPTTCSWSAAEVAALARNVTFVIRRREPPRIADEVHVMFNLTDRDGLVGISYATVTVIHICNTGRLYLNATDMSTTAVAVFDEFRPMAWVDLVEGPVMIRNNDSEIITEIEVIITDNFDQGNDELRVNGDGVIVALLPIGLRITGMFTIVEAQNIVTRIQFRNTDECRIVDPRTVTIRLRDDCGAWTNIGTVTINLRRNNDAPVVFPRSGSRHSIQLTYVVEGVANTNPPHLRVFPYFEVEDCDGPEQGRLKSMNVTIMDVSDFPHERIYFNETVLNVTGLHVEVVQVDGHVVRYDIYYPNGTAPIMYFVRLIRGLYYINEAECPFEVTRKIIVTVSDGEDTGDGLAIIYYHRNPVGPTLKWNESDHETWSAAFNLLDRPDFDLIPGDVHFMRKAQITITNPIESATNPGNFFDHVFIDEADEDSVTALGIQILQDRKGPQIVLKHDGLVSNVDAAQFESILRKVKFDSLDPRKNCDRRITVAVWDSPLKRMSNVITVQVVVGRSTEDSECPIAPTTEAPTTPEITTEAPTTPDMAPTTSEMTTEPPTTPDMTTEAPTTPEITTEAPTTPDMAPTTSEMTTEPPTTPDMTTEAPKTLETATCDPDYSRSYNKRSIIPIYSPGCPVFREDQESILLFQTGGTIYDGDHKQNHKIESAEFYIDDIDEYMDADYVALHANVSGTNITQHYYPSEGKLVLTGLDDAFKYDQVIATIVFSSTASTPPSEIRLISFSIFDGDFWSPEYVVRVLTMFVNNHAPCIALIANAKAYVEHGDPINVFADVIISDADHPDQFLLEEAMIWVVGSFSGSCFGEQLIHVDIGQYTDKVMLVPDNPAGLIHLRGNASVRVYQHIIQTATFNSTGPEPPRGSVTIKVKINDGKFTGEANATLYIETFNDSPPRIRGIPLSEPVFIPNKGPVLVTSMVDLEDCDDNKIHLWTKVEASIAILTPDFADEFLEVNTGSVDSVVRSDTTTRQKIILIPSGRHALIRGFERVLRTLTYDNRNENISCPVRRIIKLKAWDGRFMTEKDVPVVIEPNNQFKPVLSITRTGHSFEEDGPAINLLTRARVSDRDMVCDTLVMQGAQVNVTAPDGTDDIIEFDLVGTGVSVAIRTTNADGTDTIELTGNVNAHVYASIIQSIRYRNSKDEPTLSQRHIWIRVFDGEFYSVSVMLIVNLVSRNDQPPVLNSPYMVYNFSENGPPVSFFGINLTDADSDEDDKKASFIEVWIEDQINEPDERLYVELNDSVLLGGITVTQSSPSRVRINGPAGGDPLSKFIQVLRTLSYTNSNPEPTPGRRRILFRIISNTLPPNNDVTQSIYVDVFGVNDSPTWLDISAPVNYTEGSPPIRLAPYAVARDADLQPINVSILSLEITILGNYSGAAIDCPHCTLGNVSNILSISSTRIFILCSFCGWTADDVAEFARNVTFAIVGQESSEMLNEVRGKFVVTDIDGLKGTTYVIVTVIRSPPEATEIPTSG